MTTQHQNLLLNAPDQPVPAARVQWKGTDVCFDFDCECGAFGHFDGYNAYFVKCGTCDKVYEMPYALPLQKPRDGVWAIPVETDNK